MRRIQDEHSISYLCKDCEDRPNYERALLVCLEIFTDMADFGNSNMKWAVLKTLNETIYAMDEDKQNELIKKLNVLLHSARRSIEGVE